RHRWRRAGRPTGAIGPSVSLHPERLDLDVEMLRVLGGVLGVVLPVFLEHGKDLIPQPQSLRGGEPEAEVAEGARLAPLLGLGCDALDGPLHLLGVDEGEGAMKAGGLL